MKEIKEKERKRGRERIEKETKGKEIGVEQK